MKIHYSALAFLLVCVFGLSACAYPAPAAPSTSVPLEGTPWVLGAFIESGVETPALDGVPVNLVFDPAKGQVNGKAGCNSYFGGYKLDGNKLTVPGPIGSTKMACGGAIMNQESRFLNALQSAQGYSITGSKLTVNCGAVQLVFARG